MSRRFGTPGGRIAGSYRSARGLHRSGSCGCGGGARRSVGSRSCHGSIGADGNVRDLAFDGGSRYYFRCILQRIRHPRRPRTRSIIHG